MRVSYRWLQSFFTEPLPLPERLKEVLTMHSFEIESLEEFYGDALFEIAVLPNRMHDCLSHYGIAREIGILLDMKLKETGFKEYHTEQMPLLIDVEDPVLCRRYIGRIIGGISVKESPPWLKERLASVGQKSINNIVDAANYVMWEIGQPLHVFDYDKIEKIGMQGVIYVRRAEDGEKMTTLDEHEVVLTRDMLLIADATGPLALAGIKGGKKAEVTFATKKVFLEAANFSPSHIRRTSKELQLKTDSSQRFEADLAFPFAEHGMKRLTDIILEVAGTSHTSIGSANDFHIRYPVTYRIGTSEKDVNSLIGASLSEDDIARILDQLQFPYESIVPRDVIRESVHMCEDMPYRYGASVTRDAPRYFDCSSFTAYIMSSVGFTLPRRAVEQYATGVSVLESELMIGDLLFSHTPSSEEEVNHVGIYVGDGIVAHASGVWHKGCVSVEPFKQSLAFKDLKGIRRIADVSLRRFVITVPWWRLDLKEEADLIEEITRVYGLSRIAALVPEDKQTSKYKPAVNRSYYYAEKIRRAAVECGYSEVMTYSFEKKGELKLANPLAEGKEFYRRSLADNFEGALSLNEKHGDLLGLDTVKIFEIGNVWGDGKEETHLIFGAIKDVKEEVIAMISSVFRGKVFENIYKGSRSVHEYNFTELIEDLPLPAAYDAFDAYKTSGGKYKPISLFPYIVRDISLYVPIETKPEAVLNVIQSIGLEYLFHVRLFDEFRGKDKGGEDCLSYAFRLVFQSFERTLRNDEADIWMEKVYTAIRLKEGWVIR